MTGGNITAFCVSRRLLSAKFEIADFSCQAVSQNDPTNAPTDRRIEIERRDRGEAGTLFTSIHQRVCVLYEIRNSSHTPGASNRFFTIARFVVMEAWLNALGSLIHQLKLLVGGLSEFNGWELQLSYQLTYLLPPLNAQFDRHLERPESKRQSESKCQGKDEEKANIED